MVTKLSTGQELINEAKRIQNEFSKHNEDYSLESCLEAVIEKDSVETNQNAINSARIVAKGIDNEIINQTHE